MHPRRPGQRLRHAPAAALFPAAVRCAAMAIGCNFAVAALGGTTPLVTEALASIPGDDLMPAYYLMVAGAIGPVSVRREQRELVTTSKDLYSFSKDRSTPP